MLIRALPAIRQRVPGAALVIVGGGPYRTSLRRLAHDFGVAEHVVFTDGVPGDELPAHHAMADVFAMPCRTRGARPGRRGPGHRLSGGVGDRACRWSPAAPAGPRRPCATARRAWWSTAGTSARSRRRSATCWPTRTGPRGWARRAGAGCVDNWQWTHSGAQRLRRTALAGSCRRAPRCRLANFSATTLRLTFSVGVSSPVSSVKSTGRMRNLRIDSAWDTAWLASLTARSISATQVGVVGQVADRRAGVLAVALLPAGERLGVDGDQRGDERLGVADHHRLADQRVRPQPVLEHARARRSCRPR